MEASHAHAREIYSRLFRNSREIPVLWVPACAGKVDVEDKVLMVLSVSTGRALAPVRLQLGTEHLDLRASGWRTTTGFLLRRPASATVTFTPALAK